MTRRAWRTALAARLLVTLLAVLLLAGLAMLLGGCGLVPVSTAPAGSAPRPGAPAVALVVGRHAGAPDPVLTPVLRAALDDAVAGEGSASLVAADGRPSVDETAVFTRHCAGYACDDQAARQRAGAERAVAALRPGEPETDLVDALSVAARTLPPTGGTRTLLVADAGLPTAGPLRFTDPGVLAADPDDVAGFLAATSALPPLAGVDVVFSGLGDTADPQAPPGEAVRARLRAVWEAVARRAGAHDVRFDDTPSGAPTVPGLPPVTPVPIPEAPVFSGAEISLPEATLGFRPDTAELVDPGATSTLLAPLAQRIVRESLRATLTGTTSSAGAPADRAALSLARARAVAGVLTGLGVPPDRISAEGAGYLAQPPDTDSDRLLPGPAAQNRRVVARLVPGV